ncbi:phosphate ABC transporter ATP-binding protein PstB [Candidatus Bipolaricaulota bacterium]|nr:phosphate ABC transporter ATP-binding protein PstB [Candidatus Bipolaricaulota bacterium]
MLTVKELNFYYSKTQVLRDVNIEIPGNEVTAIIGPSGCGKSSFLKALNRLYEIIPGARVTGEIIYNGGNLLSRDVDVVGLRKEIGMVFQRPNPFPKSIYANVAYGPRLHGVKRKELDRIVEESLRKAGLWDEVKDKLNKSGLDLSGGEQQRLCIARCLAVEPKIILMDEPCSALDPIATAKIEDLIYNLKQDYTVIIVTHNMQQAARVSDKTAVFLTGGKMVEYGETVKIFENPENKIVENYITGKFG